MYPQGIPHCNLKKKKKKHKAVLEPRASPAFAITYFCNHCNIRFENTSKYVDTLTFFSKNLNQRSLTPRWSTFDPMSVEVTCVTLPKDHCVQVPWQYINVCGYSDQFCKIPHTYTYIHTYYVQNEWSHSLLLNSVQVRQKKSAGQYMKLSHIFTKSSPSRCPFWKKSYRWGLYCKVFIFNFKIVIVYLWANLPGAVLGGLRWLGDRRLVLACLSYVVWGRRSSCPSDEGNWYGLSGSQLTLVAGLSPVSK